MNIERSMLKITDRCRGSTIIRPTAILTILWFCGKRISNQVKSNMYKCYGNKVASSRMCKRESGENPERYRHCERGVAFITTGRPGRESSVEPSQENCLIVRSRIRGLRICILNNNTELLFMCIARESCVSRRPQKAAVFLYISVFWKYMKRGR